MKHPELDAAVVEVEQALPNMIEAGDVAEWADVRDLLRAYARRLTDCAGLIDGMCAETIPWDKGATIISEGRVFARTGKPTRKAWKTDELRVAVLDSRLYDQSTGELIEETPVEKILAVWNLTAPRVTALAARGIDVDEFCVTEWSNVGVREAS